MSADDERRNREAIAEVATVLNSVFISTVLLAKESIQTGSTITGAPGQPVDEGTLFRSWQHEFDNPTNPTSATISSNVEYAEAVEDGVGPHGPVAYGRKNDIGGSHSVKLTVAGMPKLLDEAMRRFGAARG